MESRKSIYFVLGGPGSGKGTFCTNMVNRYPERFVHLSAGDLLRQFNREHDPLNSTDIQKERFALIDRCIKEGLIVPAEITIELLLEEVSRSKTNLFLIDGFPRNKDNYEGWCALSTKYKDIDVSGVLFLNCGEETMLKRINKRAGESDEKRVDDNTEAFKKRINTFLNETVPIIKMYEKQGYVVEINSEVDQKSMYLQLVESKIIPDII